MPIEKKKGVRKPQKKSRNPKGRPQGEYVAPWNERNSFGVYIVPSAEKIVLDMEWYGGNLQRFKEVIAGSKDPDFLVCLHVACVDRLSEKGNEDHLARWQHLINLHLICQLEGLEVCLTNRLCQDVKQGGSIRETLAELKALLQSRNIKAKPPEVTKAVEEAEPDGMPTDEQDILDTLDAENEDEWQAPEDNEPLLQEELESETSAKKLGQLPE